MSSLRHPLALVAAVLLLASCGGSEDSDDTSKPEAGATTGSSSVAPTDDATESPEGSGGAEAGTVARAAFCDDIDPAAVADLLDIDEAEVIADYEPGDEIPAGDGVAPVVAPYWTCTIGTTSGAAIGATWNVGNVDAQPADAQTNLERQTIALGSDGCADVEDETLGAGTRGIDCEGDAGGTRFVLAARSVVVDGTQLDCSIASTGDDELATIVAAVPEVCGLFRDLVVR